MKKEFKPGTLLAPLPAVMVSCGSMEKPNIITIAWTGIICSEPPRTYISIAKQRFSHDIIENTREFVINLTTDKLAKATDLCGCKSGAKIDKFKETGLTPIPAEHVSCPMIEESPLCLECKVFQVERLGSHDMYMADIVAVHADESILSDDGKICLENAGLITYFHGAYHPTVKRAIGRFGFSVMKPKTKKRIAKQKRTAK